MGNCLASKFSLVEKHQFNFAFSKFYLLRGRNEVEVFKVVTTIKRCGVESGIYDHVITSAILQHAWETVQKEFWFHLWVETGFTIFVWLFFVISTHAEVLKTQARTDVYKLPLAEIGEVM